MIWANFGKIWAKLGQNFIAPQILGKTSLPQNLGKTSLPPKFFWAGTAMAFSKKKKVFTWNRSQP